MKTTRGYAYTKECENMIRNWANPGIESPHLLIRQPLKGGVGCLEFVESLAIADYAKQARTRSFKQSYLALKYPDGRLMDFQRFFDSPLRVANHYNRFEGVFCIDLSGWTDRTRSPEFEMLLEYLDNHKEKVKYVFVASANQAQETQELYNCLSGVMRIREIEMTYPKVDSFLSYAVEELDGKGIAISNDAEPVLGQYINDLSNRSGFIGYETVNRLVDEVVYSLKEGQEAQGLVTKDRLLALQAICLQCVPESKPAKRMGF